MGTRFEIVMKALEGAGITPGQIAEIIGPQTYEMMRYCHENDITLKEFIYEMERAEDHDTLEELIYKK